MKRLVIFFVLVLVILFIVGRIQKNSEEPTAPTGNESAENGFSTNINLSRDETVCVQAGWNKITITVNGLERDLLWKGPSTWTKGAIITLHGGGGHHHGWCTGGALVQQQIAFSTRAIEEGFAVFALNSTDDVVVDAQGRVCGKRFDTMTLGTNNIDLAFIEKVITEILPSVRPIQSSKNLFVTGESTGGFMTIKAGSYLNDSITAFAPVASGDPYGIIFDCDPKLSPRDSAKGIGIDRDTGKQITEKDACISSYAKEQKWDDGGAKLKPAFKQFHSEDDGIVDMSCRIRATEQLIAHGYRDAGAEIIPASGADPLLAHLWRLRYNEPILKFFGGF